MTLRELINQVTDFDSESPILDYELQPYYYISGGHEKQQILKIEVDNTKSIIYIETEE